MRVPNDGTGSGSGFGAPAVVVSVPCPDCDGQGCAACEQEGIRLLRVLPSEATLAPDELLKRYPLSPRGTDRGSALPDHGG